MKDNCFTEFCCFLSNMNQPSKVKVEVAQTCLTLCDPMGCTVHGILQTRILEWVAFSFSKGSNPGLPHCRRILYQLSHKGSPRILEWAAYPFSRGSSRPRNWTRVSCIAGKFFTNWAIREARGGLEVRFKYHFNRKKGREEGLGLLRRSKLKKTTSQKLKYSWFKIC